MVRARVADGNPLAETPETADDDETWHMDQMLGHTLKDGHRLRKLGPKELVMARRAFNDIDQDGNGHIDINEVRTPPSASCFTTNFPLCRQIRSVIEDLGQQETGEALTKEEIDEILVTLDDNGDGTISFEGMAAAPSS